MILLTLAQNAPSTGLAMFGKTAFALLIILAIIFAAAYLLRRLGGTTGVGGQRLKVVSSVAVGQRERVVIVEVEQTWLVLGVGGGQVSKLHELPTPSDTHSAAPHVDSDSFASKLRQSLATKGPGPR